MVKHIVLFKLKDEVSAEEKLVVMNKFKEAIEALPAKIPVIRKVEVGLNMNPGETWNIALYSEFDTLEDVKYYATHPDHVAAGRILAEKNEKVNFFTAFKLCCMCFASADQRSGKVQD